MADEPILQPSEGMTRLTLAMVVVDMAQGHNDFDVIISTEVPTVAGPWGPDDVVDACLPLAAWSQDGELLIVLQKCFINGEMVRETQFAV